MLTWYTYNQLKDFSVEIKLKNMKYKFNFSFCKDTLAKSSQRNQFQFIAHILQQCNLIDCWSINLFPAQGTSKVVLTQACLRDKYELNSPTGPIHHVSPSRLSSKLQDWQLHCSARTILHQPICVWLKWEPLFFSLVVEYILWFVRYYKE